MTDAFFNGQPVKLIQVLALMPPQAACCDPKTGAPFIVPWASLKINVGQERPPGYKDLKRK